MNIKQKDAGIKKCPMPSGYTGDEGVMYCSGNECMMWRWAFNDIGTETENCIGFCGLAGRPL